MQELDLFYNRIIYREDISWKTCSLIPADNYMFKVNNKNTRTRCEIRSKLTIKTPERRQWRCSSVFIVNFETLLVHLKETIEIRVDDLLQLIKTNEKFLTWESRFQVHPS